ncbi:hypothetical protein [Ruegeria sp. HKCCA4633]|uniref:hypothetical protein n=1 Tax=Ruegeria sp. HKCCA4633 TaxID=2682983 RepID=UPI001488B372|nr:hypothetical protein [Ruegeria sp. HKCCA4633]
MSRISLCSAFLTSAQLMVGAAAEAEENASNPLAAVNNTDIRYQYFDLEGDVDRQDAFIDGAYMLRPNLKLKYELHYNSTNATGTRFSGFEKTNFKLIYFPSQQPLNDTWSVKSALGLEWILDFGEPNEGIGTGSDQIAPFGGFAFANANTGLTLIPLVQHFASYNGPTDISQTAMRLIALQSFGDGYWIKADIKAPYDWENDAWPATAEFQIGKNFSPRVALYADILIGIGADRPYDQGAGIGLRFNY